MRIFDLSQPVGSNAGEPVPVVVELLSHEAGAAVLGASHGVTARHFPGGFAISMETVTLTSHSGTHIDAPLHYGPTCEGRAARSVDVLPLDWFYRPGIVLRFDPDPERGAVGREEMASALAASRASIARGTIVLCDVGAASRWGSPAYFTHFRGIGADAISLLIDLGVRVVGTDAFGMDPPFTRMLDAFRDSGDNSHLWPAHVLGRSREYCQIERLGGLNALPADHGFTVACFPIRLQDCGAAWVRAVAIYHEA